jgi:hypothetical protein
LRALIIDALGWNAGATAANPTADPLVTMQVKDATTSMTGCLFASDGRESYGLPAIGDVAAVR